MDEKSLQLLEYDKILGRLAKYAAFQASEELALGLRPENDLEAVRYRLGLTSEARLLLDTTDYSVGGARDVRDLTDRAAHGLVLDPVDLLDVRNTLLVGRSTRRFFEKRNEHFPRLFDLAMQLPQPPGLVEAITQAISERGDILDSASQKLGALRSQARVVNDRLQSRLQRMVNDPNNAQILQENLVTQRDGRYVIPLRAEFKGRIKAVVHDQSASGATLFVEPLAIVELNNEHREILLAIRDEERRILAELSGRVGMAATEIDQMVFLLAEIDLALACAKYAFALKANEPQMLAFRTRKQGKHPGSVIHLYEARHPLLDPQTVVPIDVELDDKTYVMVVTGPNTGGKTVSLKTIGLLILMAQSGLHIPARSDSEISIFENVYADIGDEQSIEQSLSTFSGHMRNIIRILKEAEGHALVLLDELGAGTDPQEGAALARALLGHLLERSITTLVTTHHPELKAFAHATPGAVNASVEFDLESLRPTYRLTIGLPGRSNALAIASRLGMPEEIISVARGELSPTDIRAEDLLDEIHRQREIARQARAAAERDRKDAEKLSQDLNRRLETIEDERRAVLEGARLQAHQRSEEVETELNELRRQLARARQPLEALKSVEGNLNAVQEQLEEPTPRRTPARRSQPGTPTARRVIRLGSRVRLRSLGTEGVVTALSEDDAEVQVGVLRVRARRSDLELPNAEPEPETAEPVRAVAGATLKRKDDVSAEDVAASLPVSPGIELDIRGQRSDEALDALDRYLDAAYLAGLPWVRIIHGKGTGRLREAVRQALSAHAHVRSHEKGGDNEGGDGVTVARLRTG